jgi:hypothetical protein
MGCLCGFCGVAYLPDLPPTSSSHSSCCANLGLFCISSHGTIFQFKTIIFFFSSFTIILLSPKGFLAFQHPLFLPDLALLFNTLNTASETRVLQLAISLHKKL